MPDPVELLVTPERVDLVADQLFGIGANAVSEELTTVDGIEVVRLVADPDPALLAASGLEWCPHRPEPSTPPSPRTVLDVGDVSVAIDATAAFGSGSHPTTRLCAQLVPDVVREGCRVLDVGSGSGVLGVAAAMLGATSVVSIDIDPAAVAATSSTASLNGVGENVRVSDTPLAEVDGRFDVVFANLLIPVIEELGVDLERRLAPGGRLVIGGVLVHQVDRAVEAVATLHVERTVELGDWVTLLMVR